MKCKFIESASIFFAFKIQVSKVLMSNFLLEKRLCKSLNGKLLDGRMRWQCVLIENLDVHVDMWACECGYANKQFVKSECIWYCIFLLFTRRDDSILTCVHCLLICFYCNVASAHWCCICQWIKKVVDLWIIKTWQWSVICIQWKLVFLVKEKSRGQQDVKCVINAPFLSHN